MVFIFLNLNSMQNLIPCSYSWYPQPNEMQDMINLTYFMIKDMFDQTFLESTTTMCFIQTVQQHYQQVAFHNFEHAFMFTHCVYNTLKQNPKYFNLIEVNNSENLIYTICQIS